jgi:hypothetical protein
MECDPCNHYCWNYIVSPFPGSDLSTLEQVVDLAFSAIMSISVSECSVFQILLADCWTMATLR